ncbi:MAG: hypothetical protein L0Z50_18545 [Verrucomicrobiales bacterium]|nr:hypothetical protein [Verrucomicrobiales bacterium]
MLESMVRPAMIARQQKAGNGAFDIAHHAFDFGAGLHHLRQKMNGSRHHFLEDCR